MAAKFIVVECSDNSSALEMVRLMLEHGYVRLTLLDDLSKHPSLQHKSPSSSSHSPSPREFEPKNNSLKDILTKPAPAKSKVQSDKESSDILDLFCLSTPEIITVKGGIKEEVDQEEEQTADSYADEEQQSSFPFDLASSSSVSQLDFLAQAHCLAGASSPSDAGVPPAKRSRHSMDPEKDYHTCQICGTRVKAPRGGRWNLQMHVMAMHSQQRPFKCPKCPYTDYRKPGMRKHTMMTHGADLEPEDISTDEKRNEWDSVMGQCFPEFAYRTGFLATATSQGAFSVGGDNGSSKGENRSE